MGGTGREAGDRVRGAGGRHLARAAAVATGVLATLVAVELATAVAVERYAFALVGTVVVSTIAAAGCMWAGCTFGARLTTGGLAGTTLAGQMLVSTHGGPAGPSAHWDLGGVAVATASVVVLLLVAAAPRPRPTGRHPYAL